MKKLLIILPIAGIFIYGLIALIQWDPQGTAIATTDNVVIEDGTQYIDLTAKGGYSPRLTAAQAGLPTVLKVTTNGTYDCSSSISIPDYGLSEYLPPSGTTEINLGTPEVGILQGTCGMGMYRFEIDFES